MNNAEYKKVRVGAIVESLYDIGNRLGRVPAGTRFQVTYKRSGFDLEQLEPCSCCGFRLRVHGVQPFDVKLVEP